MPRNVPLFIICLAYNSYHLVLSLNLFGGNEHFLGSVKCQIFYIYCTYILSFLLMDDNPAGISFKKLYIIITARNLIVSPKMYGKHKTLCTSQ
jgi:hypothetical protein